MPLVNSGQFNWDNWEFVNFPNFCGDATILVSYLNISISDFPPIANTIKKKYIMPIFLLMEISYYIIFYPQGEVWVRHWNEKELKQI